MAQKEEVKETAVEERAALPPWVMIHPSYCYQGQPPQKYLFNFPFQAVFPSVFYEAVVVAYIVELDSFLVLGVNASLVK